MIRIALEGPPEELQRAVDWILKQEDAGRGVLIYCITKAVPSENGRYRLCARLEIEQETV